MGLEAAPLAPCLPTTLQANCQYSFRTSRCDVVDVPAGGLASSRLGGGLGLLSLLDALGSSALLLALLDGGLAGSRAGLGAL